MFTTKLNIAVTSLPTDLSSYQKIWILKYITNQIPDIFKSGIQVMVASEYRSIIQTTVHKTKFLSRDLRKSKSSEFQSGI